jgi:hypothetical protein
VLRLRSAQVTADLHLQRGIDLVQEVHHHDVLGRDGAVRLELEQPVSFGMLARHECIPCVHDRAIQGRVRHSPQRVRHDVAAHIGLRPGVWARLRCDAAHDPEFP